jgi:imidazolonepropionase-like amidohydrolase
MTTLRRTAAAVALLAFVQLPAAAQSPHPPATLAITHAAVVDPANDTVLPDRTILVAGDRIVALGPSGSVSVPAGATVVDAAGRYVMPGLADMHVHFSSDGGLLPRDSATTGRALRQFVFYGVTTVLNLGASGGRSDEITEVRRRIAAGELAGPTIYATGSLITIPGSHPIGTVMHLPEGADSAAYDWSRRGVLVVRAAEEMREAVRRIAGAGMDGVKIVIESGPPPFGDHHPQMPPALAEAAVAEAARHGLPVFAHVSSVDELEVAVAAGVRAVVHLVGPGPLPPALLEEMRRRGVRYIPTLSLFLRAGTWGEPSAALTDPFLTAGVERRVLESLLASPLAPKAPPTDAARARRARTLRELPVARDAGVTIVAGTDVGSPFVFPGYGMHHELALLVEAGLTPAEALTAATRSAAELIGRGAEFGLVAPGMRADLVLLDANPLADIRNTRTIQAVVAGGRLYRRAELDALVGRRQ